MTRPKKAVPQSSGLRTGIAGMMITQMTEMEHEARRPDAGIFCEIIYFCFSRMRQAGWLPGFPEKGAIQQ